ncbi:MULTISPECIES: helix-turn-helix domain-containing protein [Clostridium]|uniref:PucR family transcriptional regulator n=1 Tax=Clostridium TaxID=1485 RepID=UPI0013FC5C2D|nr:MULTISPECIES: helix-turn-helix domain-containing protein [Clostridium]MBY7023999.1 helix-turn-helix domain-containing protein [Clostridium botulinum]NFO30134.1 PucR family transcriptional regulator [Clostridium botulinum]NFO45895.1 PucR family transcriptional regulator [Clostridium botulinum]NFO53043.1 PucR family transcriptional regulator [Clostridium botulinum]
MQKKNDLYKKKYELYNSLFTENSIDGILNIGENFLGNPIFILDTSYRIISRSSLAKLDNSSIETHNGESYLLLDIVQLMQKNKCIDNIYNSDNAFFHNSDEILIFCSIRINNITVGYISVLQSKRKFNSEDLELTNVLSKVFSIQLQKENLFISNSGLDEEYYLTDLLINKIDNVEYITERLQYINFNLYENLIILSIPFKQKYKDYRHNFGLKELIKKIKTILGNCISTYYNDTITFLISNEHKDVINDSFKETLLEFLKLNNLCCGISIVFQNLLHIQDFFYQSIYALELSSCMKRDSTINYFEDYIEYYLFNMSMSTTNDLYKINLLTLVHPYIKKLIKFDDQNKTELFKTLKAYLENNRNANDTSIQLNIHRSTFFYRYNKIQGLLDISLGNNNNLFKLELSFKILDYNTLTKIQTIDFLRV